jgi:hypothetical protein
MGPAVPLVSATSAVFGPKYVLALSGPLWTQGGSSALRYVRSSARRLQEGNRMNESQRHSIGCTDSIARRTALTRLSFPLELVGLVRILIPWRL